MASKLCVSGIVPSNGSILWPSLPSTGSRGAASPAHRHYVGIVAARAAVCCIATRELESDSPEGFGFGNACFRNKGGKFMMQ
jgi:hypothetical protein